jgi:coproporphyrinogen III oxidase
LFGSSDLNFSDCLTDTVTNKDDLVANKDKMKCKMEAYITNLQGQIIKKLQELETEQKFVIDKWSRKEGGGGMWAKYFVFLFF